MEPPSSGDHTLSDSELVTTSTSKSGIPLSRRYGAAHPIYYLPFLIITSMLTTGS